MMTVEKCREVLARYEVEIPAFQRQFRRVSDRGLDHVLTMIPKMRVMLDEADRLHRGLRGMADDADVIVETITLDTLIKRREKFMRWLGFAQGVLYSEGVYTIEQLKAHNKPDDEA